jgi:triphosphoribosyl-dephospho-CoA synthase
VTGEGDPAHIAADVAAAAQLACLLEATAPKPGNVSPGRRFGDLTYEDLLASAAAIGGPLAGVGTRPLGTTIRLAIEATRRWADTNTNLGMVLLLTPLARAAVLARKDPVRPFSELRDALRQVLAETTVEDARQVYAAIRLASPGGLGRVDEQDVADEPSVTLLDAMRLSAGRDGIAAEYATGFAVTFEIGAPVLERARSDGLRWNEAVVETFLTILANSPDSHVARRGGADLAADVSRRACAAVAAGGTRTQEGRRVIADMDRALRDPQHLANPGTTADLTAAAIFVVLVDSMMKA